MARPTRVLIDLDALDHNARVIRALARRRRLMAVIKANAYGHGMVDCARVLASHVDAFAVAFLEEAVALRAGGITTPVLVLEGPLSEAEVLDFTQLDLWPAIHANEQLHWFENAPQRAITGLWLKADTGMHRLGIDLDDMPAAIERATTLTAGNVTLMSHLADAAMPESLLSQRQLARWQSLVDRYDLETSLLNSASTLVQSTGDSDWLRPGYLFYGGHPDGLGEVLDLQPVMRLESRVIAIRDIAQGETVGYGGRWRAERDSRIATIPIGYADGYPRAARDGTPVLVGGHVVSLAGRVSMDMITVDITDRPDIDIGADVVLWGDRPTVDDIADAADTIGYELASQVTQRVRRRVVSRNMPDSE